MLFKPCPDDDLVVIRQSYDDLLPNGRSTIFFVDEGDAVLVKDGFDGDKKYAVDDVGEYGVFVVMAGRRMESNSLTRILTS